MLPTGHTPGIRPLPPTQKENDVADDFYSFDEALNELKLKEEELKRLVSEGEIRAFRKGDTMKLRRKDVEELRAELDSDLVDLGDTSDELVFEDETDLGDAGMATQELDVETLIDEPVEELELDDIKERAPVAAAVGARAARSGGRSSSSRSGSGRGKSDAVEAPTVRRTSAVAKAKVDAAEEPAWVKGLLAGTALLLFLGAPMIVSLLTGSASGFAKGVAGVMGNVFDADSDSNAPDPSEDKE